MKLRTTSLTALTLTAALLASGSAFAKSAAKWLEITAPVQVGLNQAVEKALAVAPGRAIEADMKAGKKGAAPYYEVTVVSHSHDEIKLKVNAVTGEAVVNKNKGKVAFRHDKHLDESHISLTQAVDAAIAAVPGKPLEAELGSDWGKASYKVKLLQADKIVTEVKLSAETGKVTASKKN